MGTLIAIGLDIAKTPLKSMVSMRSDLQSSVRRYNDRQFSFLSEQSPVLWELRHVHRPLLGPLDLGPHSRTHAGGRGLLKQRKAGIIEFI